MTLRVLILHNAVAANADASEADVLVQVEVVEQACQKLGHATERLGCTLDLSQLASQLNRNRPDVAFNLVESLDGSDRLASLVPALLATHGIPFTGSSQAVLDLTNDKPRAKQKLLSCSLPTAPWLSLRDRSSQLPLPGKYILKAIWEHASVGIDDSSIVDVDSAAELKTLLKERGARFRGGAFAEQFIAGREFNLSLLAGPDGPQVLPPAEIDFIRFPADKPRIVGYDAKWSEGSFEFDHTPRRFEYPPQDQPLLRQLEYLARGCWNACDLRGYVRVDFRVDERDQPWILEINTNPCLSPDAGFAAALAEAGIDFPTAVQRILDDALLDSTRLDGDLPQGRSLPAQTTLEGRRDDQDVDFRTEVQSSDGPAIREIVSATGKFRPAEVDVAVELVEERLAKGPASGYEFVIAERGGAMLGYACFGQIAVTVASYDLYWIAVDPRLQSRGLGKALMQRTEAGVRKAGGERIYIETSGRPDYWTTRAFYESCGYRVDSRMADFYATGDDKILYVKRL